MNTASSLHMSGPLQSLRTFNPQSFSHAFDFLRHSNESKAVQNLTPSTIQTEDRPFILLITDNPKTNQLVTQLLDLNSAFQIYTATSIADAVELIQQRCPDLILCDVNKNVEILIKAMNHVQDREVPFLLFSKASNKKKNLCLLGQGITDFIITPFEGEELQAKVKNHLDTCQARRLLQNALQKSGLSLIDLAEKISERCLELKKMNRMKDEFLAVLSHELRNPINVISGFSEILLTDYDLPENAQKAADAIFRNAQIQNKLVTDLLDISRSSNGKMIIDCEAIEFENILNDVLPSVKSLAQKKGILLNVHCENHSSHMNGDPIRLTQVIWNVLSNSIKFTPPGGKIDVSLRRLDRWVELKVADTGLGIEPDFLPHIFEEFHQQNSSITKNFGGLGLGLAIVRKIVELHGGTVRAFSEGPGRGATFTVLLPSILN